MRVLFDNQIFEQQSFGGISRYFEKIGSGNEVVRRMDKFLPEVQKKTIKTKIETKLQKIFLPQEKNASLKEKFYQFQLQTRDYDLFHPTYYDPYFLKYVKKPFVLTVYDMIHEKYAEYFGFNMDSVNKRMLCASAKKIVTISESTKSDLIDIFEIPEENIEVIYLATDFGSLKTAKPDIVIEGIEYILFTGNRNGYKNFLTFLIAVSSILKKNKNLHLICTGKEFNLIEKQWINELGLKDQVISCFCSVDEELTYLYRNAECFVFPSLYEGFGFPILESFACQCPLICSRGSSFEEIAGEAAVFFNPKDIKDIRQSISEVLSDKQLRQDLIVAGENRLKEFSWEKCRKETISLYSKIINELS